MCLTLLEGLEKWSYYHLHVFRTSFILSHSNEHLQVLLSLSLLSESSSLLLSAGQMQGTFAKGQRPGDEEDGVCPLKVTSSPVTFWPLFTLFISFSSVPTGLRAFSDRAQPRQPSADSPEKP